MSETLHFEQFQKTFDAYFWRWWIAVGILFLLVFGLYTVRLLNDYSDFGAIGIGFMSVGALSVGVVSIGACSVGVVAVGAFSVGIFAFGGHSFGVIAIGAGTSYGYKVGPRGRFDIGRAVGVVAIGPEAHGIYTLSYTGRGVYTLSPDHQDGKAVALFTRWLPKFKEALSPVS